MGVATQKGVDRCGVLALTSYWAVGCRASSEGAHASALNPKRRAVVWG